MKQDDVEMLKLYFEEFKYRHSHYWGMVFKFAFAILFLLGIPYIYPEEIEDINKIIFPVAAIIFCLSATWLLAAEYERLRATTEKYNQLKPKAYKPVVFGAYGLKRMLAWKVGNIVTLLFLLSFLILAILELIFITSKSDMAASLGNNMGIFLRLIN